MHLTRFMGASLLALVTASPAIAQTVPSGPSDPVTGPPQSTADQVPNVEDQTANQDTIVITATKREQSLKDVPVSVSVTSQATVEKAHIQDLIDLQSVVPSLKVEQLNAAAQTNFIIRGFGNGNGNFGIESSVGVFIDGVYRSRSFSALDDLPEIERIEVLRGPQSTLFGKNVSAGAISIITRKPQFTFVGQAEASIGNFSTRQLKATITGPLSPTLAFRLSGSFNKRDGYLTNITTGNDINDRNRYSVRGDLLWTPTSQLAVRVIADYNRIKERCCGVVTLFNGPATQFIGAPPPFGLGLPVGNPDQKFDRKVVLNTDPKSVIVGKGISAQADYDFGFAKLTSISAYRNQFNSSQEDVDFTGADLANRTDSVRTKTFTQEVRLASPGTGRLNWLLGAFYLNEKLKLDQDIRYGADIRNYANGLAGGNIALLEYLQSLVNPAVVPGQTYFQQGQGIIIPFNLDQESFSIFGQADFKVTDRLTVTGGLAYLNDRKKGASFIVLQDPFAALNLQNVPELPFLGIPANAFGGLGALQFFYGDTPNHGPVNFPNANESGVLKGNKIAYTVKAAYDFGPVNLYLAHSTGWKAGAYNLSSDSRPPSPNGVGRSADPENVSLFEAGLKSVFRGGYLNLALFKQSIKGFQSNLYLGTAYALVNAGKQSVRGFEIDAAYRPISWLSLNGAVTYLDPKYDSFLRAPCVNYDVVRCPLDPLTGRRPVFRDLSGARPAGISKWSYSASVLISRHLTSGIDAYLRGEYDYASKVQLTETTPPELSTYGTSNLNASLGFIFVGPKVELMLWGRNLTNHHSLIAAFPTVAQDGSYSGYPIQPRTYGATIRKTF